MKIFVAGAAAIGLLFSGILYADSDSSPPSLSISAAKITPVDDAWRAKLPHDPEAATDAYMARLSPGAKARSDSYFEGGYWLLLWKTLLSLVISFALLESGFSRKLRDRSEGITRFAFLQLAIYGAVFIVVSSVLSFPMSLYADFFREHQYGLLNQTFLPWFKEQLTGGAVGLVLGSPVIAILYLVVRKFPKSSHVWAAGVSTGLAAVMMLIGPVFIDPLFNDYKPLEAGPIRARLLSMARSNGIPAQEIYQFDASKQTDRISANVSGFANTVSIRLNDNLLRRTTLPEIVSVTGHEMGHYVLNHVYKGLLAFAVLFFALFTIIRWSFETLLARFGARWGIRSLGDSAGLPLVIGLFTIYGFLLTPVFNSLIRSQEAEADLFGLNTAREPDANAEIDLKLTEYRKPDPGPIEEFVFFDHPSARNRILMAMRWKAENLK